ncbi:MAG: hypothetical protein AAGA35_04065 [Patescibacteria group bacterium]
MKERVYDWIRCAFFLALVVFLIFASSQAEETVLKQAGDSVAYAIAGILVLAAAFACIQPDLERLVTKKKSQT